MVNTTLTQVEQLEKLGPIPYLNFKLALLREEQKCANSRPPDPQTFQLTKPQNRKPYFKNNKKARPKKPPVESQKKIQYDRRYPGNSGKGRKNFIDFNKIPELVIGREILPGIHEKNEYGIRTKFNIEYPSSSDDEEECDTFYDASEWHPNYSNCKCCKGYVKTCEGKKKCTCPKYHF